MKDEQVFLGGAPRVGFGDLGTAPPVAMAAVAAPSPWPIAFATTIVSAATGWVIEEVATAIRGKRRRRR